MAIQLRRGASTDYDASMMLEGEAAVFTDTNEFVFKGTQSVVLLGTNIQSLSTTQKYNVLHNLGLIYKAGDTYLGSGEADTVHGFITSSGTAIQLAIHVPSSLMNITTITFSGTILVRGIGGYVVSSNAFDPTTYSDFRLEKENNYEIKMTVKGTSALSGATNNTPVVAVVSGQFTFA